MQRIRKNKMNNLNQYKTYLINTKCCLTYYNYLRPLFAYLEEQKLEFTVITKDQLANYFTVKNYKPASINKLIGACHNYCKYNNITTHASFEIKSLDVGHKQRKYMTEDDIKQSLKYISTYNNKLNMQKVEAILYFMLYTAVRKSEIFNLKRDKFNFKENTVQIYEKKLKKEKTIPFPGKFAAKLQNYFGSEEEKENAFNINEAWLNDLFRRILSNYLGKHLSPHMLRHGGAKFLLKNGISLPAVQWILGHANIKTTMIYAVSDEEQVLEIYRKNLG